MLAQPIYFDAGRGELLAGKLRNVFCFVMLDEHAENLHQRCQRMILVFANLVNQSIQQSNYSFIFFLHHR